MHEPTWAPVAVVALGDPSHRDDGIPLRLLGRVRTLIGEIGCSRASRRLLPGSADSGDAVQGALALDVSAPRGETVQWIEGGVETGRLDPFLEGRRRVVLIDSVDQGRKPGSVAHWHLGTARHGITLLENYGRPDEVDLDHLAFWLEDDLPPGGLDLIAIQPDDTREGVGLSPRLQERFATICSQVTALVFRILVEEGW